MNAGAFMLNWLDVDEHAVDAFEDWHNHEHVAERLSVPGFLAGFRYRSADAAPPAGASWLITYDVSDLGVLQSAAYAERLNNPTFRTRHVVPHLRRVSRMAYRSIVDVGGGVGSCLWIIHLPLGAVTGTDGMTAMAGAVSRMVDLPAVTRARLGCPHREAADFKRSTAEGKATEGGFRREDSWCLMVETSRDVSWPDVDKILKVSAPILKRREYRKNKYFLCFGLLL